MTKSYNYLLVGEIMKLMHIIPFIALVIFAGCPQSESQSTKNQPDKKIIFLRMANVTCFTESSVRAKPT